MTNAFHIILSEVRDRARQISSLDIGDSSLDEYVDQAISAIYSITGKNDWDEEDYEFEGLRGAAIDFASATALIANGDPDGMATVLMDRFKYVVDNIKASTASETFGFAQSNYRSSPLR